MRYLFLLLLAGCGAMTDPDYDESSDSGLRVKWAEYNFITIEQLDKLYLEIQKCTGISKQGPLVVFVDFKPHGFDGYTTNEIILLSADNTWLIKHEFIHYLTDNSHNSPFFKSC